MTHLPREWFDRVEPDPVWRELQWPVVPAAATIVTLWEVCATLLSLRARGPAMPSGEQHATCEVKLR
jgi:hypothetical protein